jgi:hypothetical protein
MGIEPPSPYGAKAAEEAKPAAPAGCPGLRAFNFKAVAPATTGTVPAFAPVVAGQASELRQWPIQLHLINPRASQFRGSNLLLAADCAAFSAGDFHSRFLKNKTLAIACPKLDEGLDRYTEKLAILIDEAEIDTLTVLRMQVPCCGGLVALAQQAREKALNIGKRRNVPIKAITIDPEGKLLQEVWL